MLRRKATQHPTSPLNSCREKQKQGEKEEEGGEEGQREESRRWLIVGINTDTQLVWSRLCIECEMKCNKIENLMGNAMQL